MNSKDKYDTNNNRTTRKLIPTIVIWLAFLKSAISEDLHITLTGIGVILGAVLLVICFTNNDTFSRFFKVWVISAIIGGVNVICVGSLVLSNYIPMLFLYFPIALFFYTDDSPDPKWWEINYYFYACFVIYRMTNSFNSYNLFYSESRNNLSVLLLVWLFVLHLEFSKKDMVLPLRDVIVFFIGCFIANGRGGIISAILLVVFFWFIYYSRMDRIKRNKINPKRVGLVFLLILALIWFLNNYDYIVATYFYRFSEDISIKSTQNRIGVWNLYLSQLSDIKILLFGGNTFKIIPEIWNGNLHNSILMVHAQTGLIGFILFVYLTVKCCVKTVKKREWALLALIVVFLVRSFTDRIFPAKIGDVALWIIIFYYVKNDEEINST